MKQSKAVPENYKKNYADTQQIQHQSWASIRNSREKQRAKHWLIQLAIRIAPVVIGIAYYAVLDYKQSSVKMDMF